MEGFMNKVGPEIIILFVVIGFAYNGYLWWKKRKNKDQGE